jgi:hypothetical protein
VKCFGLQIDLCNALCIFSDCFLRKLLHSCFNAKLLDECFYKLKDLYPFVISLLACIFLKPARLEIILFCFDTIVEAVVNNHIPNRCDIRIKENGMDCSLQY